MSLYELFQKLKFDDTVEHLIQQIIKSYREPNFNIDYQWFHQNIQFWQKEMEKSMLFNEVELETILPLWLQYFINILHITNFNCLKAFIKFALHDLKERNEIFFENEQNWKIGLEVHNDDGQSELPRSDSAEIDLEMLDEYLNESDIDENSMSSRQSLSSPFLTKCNFLLDLLVPNGFQYTLYKNAFKPRKTETENIYRTFAYPFKLEFYNKLFCVDMKKGQTASISFIADSAFEILPLNSSMEAAQFIENLKNGIEPLPDRDTDLSSKL